MGVRRQVIGGMTLPRIPSVPVPRRHPQLSGVADSQHHYGLAEHQARAGWDPKVRLEFFDAEHVAAAVIYPTTGLHFGALTDLDLLTALCQAYNTWAHDFCSTAPERLVAAAIVPQQDVHQAVLETRRAVEELGFKGIVMRPNPIGRAIEDPAWEPFWSLLEELEVPLTFHEGTSLCIPQLGADRTENYIFQHMMSHPFEHMSAMLMMIGGGILDRHPKLRVAFIEAGCGWVPYWLERMEHHFESPYENVQLSLTPTELFQRQCWVSADAEEGAVVNAFVQSLGAENVCWSTDFPHPDHTWGGLVSRFTERADLNEGVKAKIVGGNAAALYGLA
jgi:predicted TIM-barrel fold metal-dependent hydrolase